MCAAICEDTVNGLLGTQVTWDDVQEDCFNLFGPLAKLGPNKTIKDIADGKGSISRIGVVENPWEDPTTAVKNGCPGKFVVKVATALQQEKYNKDKMDEQTRDWMIQAVFRLHNVECRLYEKIKDVQGLSRLKVYVSHPFTDENLSMGYLIMEYAENVANLGADTHLEKDLFLEILETLAKYHSCSVLFNDEEKESLKMGIVEGVFGCMLKQSFVDSCLEITSKVLGDDAVDTVERLRKAVDIVGTEANREKMDNMAETLGMERILCHGDPWTCNFLCTELDGQLRFRALLDFQTSHFGCVGHDLARFFVNLLAYKERKENVAYYIDRYYEFFTSFWPRDQELPFTKEQVSRAYHAYLPLQNYVVAVSTGMLADTRIKESSTPEITKQLLVQKIKELATDLEETLVYLETA